MKRFADRLKFFLTTKVVFGIALVFIIALMAFSFILLSMIKNNFYKQEKQKIDTLTKFKATEIGSQLLTQFEAGNSLKNLFDAIDSVPQSRRSAYLSSVLRKSLENQQKLVSLWVILEGSFADSIREKNKFSIIENSKNKSVQFFYKSNGKIVRNDLIEKNPSELVPDDMYQKVLEKQLPIVTEPQFHSFTGKQEDGFQGVRYLIPIMRGKIFSGIIGFDVNVDQILANGTKIKDYPKAQLVIVSASGKIIAHSVENTTRLSIDETNLKEFSPILQQYRYEELYSRWIQSPKSYATFIAIKTGIEELPWFLGLVVSEELFVSQYNTIFTVTIFLGIIVLIVVLLVTYLTLSRLLGPIKHITEALSELGRGIINHSIDLDIQRHDEIGQLANAVLELRNGMDKMATFATEIGKGNLLAPFEQRDENDILGNALLEMRKSLKDLREKEEMQHQLEERKRWISEGINSLGELLRQYNQNLDQLAYEVIRYIVDYIGAVQGGVYIKNDKDQINITYDLVAAIAYGRQKLLSRSVKLEEGLVGRCAAEEDLLHITELPAGYPVIRSGLGEATPDALLLVPLKSNDEVLGVIELIAFGAFDDLKIEFLAKASDDIATTISNVRINTKTKRLLEQSQKQQELLSSKEEEMRQTLEEMTATREEAEARFSQLSTLVAALNQVAMVAEFDPYGYIVDINDNFLRLLGVNREQMIGRKQGMFEKNLDFKENERMWFRLRNGETISKTQHIDTGFKTIVLSETYVPIKDANGNVIKVINIATDITKYKD
ncbi:MAG TPA: GAF domain-containing protein [Salinivirgaceae bacterium]|nr:GAF domain-containing protein [Salinivirgaceae bacterium]